MEQVRVVVIPVMLTLGALWLAGQEIRHFRDESAQGSPPWTRLLRRLTGSLVVLAVAAMLHLGDTSVEPGLSVEQATSRLYYWMAVLGLLMFAMGLAAWDVIDGLKRLRTYLDDVERDEMKALKQGLHQGKP